MQWTKRLFKRLALSSSPEERPAERQTLAAGNSAHAVEEVTGRLCAKCRQATRNPHQVRAGRARARTAERDEQGRFRRS